MQKIHVERFKNNPDCQGTIEPEDRRWKLVLDKDGVPELWLRTTFEDDNGKTQHGYVSLNEFLPEDLQPADILGGDVSEPLPPEGEEAAYADYVARCERLGGQSCPNVTDKKP